MIRLAVLTVMKKYYLEYTNKDGKEEVTIYENEKRRPLLTLTAEDAYSVYECMFALLVEGKKRQYAMESAADQKEKSRESKRSQKHPDETRNGDWNSEDIRERNRETERTGQVNQQPSDDASEDHRHVE